MTIALIVTDLEIKSVRDQADAMRARFLFAEGILSVFKKDQIRNAQLKSAALFNLI